MKKLTSAVAALLLSAGAMAAQGQVFYRFGTSMLNEDRGGQTFTDTGAVNGKNDGDQGLSIGAGLDLKLMDCPMVEGNSLLGEIYVNYSKFSDKEVANAIDVVVSSDSSKKTVTVSALEVTIAPKYMFNLGKVKPWVIPAGLSFLVNSPPSNTTSYLDLGYHVGAGVQYDLIKQLSIGVDGRYTYGFGDPQLKTRYASFGGYLGINF